MTKEEFLALASSKYEGIKALDGVGNFYDYEVALSDLMKELGLAVLEKNLGGKPSDPRKKK